MYRHIRTVLATTVIAGLACDRAPDRPIPAQNAPAPATGMIEGTPDGDLEDWVQDIRAGLDTVRGLVRGDRGEASRRVIVLYTTRQEYLGAYYGPTGRMSPTPALGSAVKTAETRFHELMRLTNATPPADAEAIERAIRAIEKQLDLVLEEAQSSPRRLRAAGREGA